MKRTLLVLSVCLIAAGLSKAAPDYGNVVGTYLDVDATNTFKVGDESALWWGTSESLTDLWTFRSSEGVYEGFDRGDGYNQDYPLVTYISGLAEGAEYDIRVIYSAHDTADWGINASLDANADLNAIENEYNKDDGIALGGTYTTGAPAYQAYIGSAVATDLGIGVPEIAVYVKPMTNPPSKAYRRTWYDGVSYSLTLLQCVNTDGSTKVFENGDTDDILVSLGKMPSGTVTISIGDSADPNQVTASPSSLTFTDSNWDVPQSITITAVDDGERNLDTTANLVFDLSSSDAEFDGYQKVVVVEVIDDESVPLLGGYVDADETNTVAADGVTDPWYQSDTTSSDLNWDGLWSFRTDKNFANEGTVLQIMNTNVSEDETGVLDNLQIKTTVTGLVPGQEYEIRAVFWARGDFEIGGESGYGSRWNIAAGLTASDTKVFTAGFDYIKGDSTEYNTGVLSALPIIRPVLDAGYTLNETQVLLGTAIADGSGQIDAYVNGAAIDGLDPRTWYEGIAYQKAMLDIVETDGSTGVTNGTTDTFTVALSEDADGSDVVAEVYEVALADEIDIISGSTLTFTSGNYTTPQSVVVSGKTDELVNTSLVIKVSSNDPAFDDYMTTVYVEDFECGAKGYLALDFNLDCEVDLEDFATFATDWMKCTDPVYSGCTSGFDWE